MWSLVDKLRVDFGLDVDQDLLLDLYDDVTIDCLPLVDRFVLVELEHDGHLRLVGHRQYEGLGDVLVLDGVVEGHPVEAYALLVEVDGVLAPGDCQVDVEEGGDGLARELPYFGLLDDLLVDLLGCGLLLLLLALDVHVACVLPVFLGLLDVEADLADAVVVADFFVADFDDDVVLVDGGVVDVGVVDGEEGAGVGHAGEG